MQIFFHLLKFIAIACLFTSFSGAAPKAKFVVAYPDLKIKKPVWVSSLPGTDKELIVSQMGTIHELPKNINDIESYALRSMIREIIDVAWVCVK